MKRSRIRAFIAVVVSFNIALIFQSFGVREVEAAFPGYNGKIGYHAWASGIGYDLLVTDFDGTISSKLTNNTLIDDLQMNYSADGSRVVFTSRRDHSQREIYTMNADGSNAVRLTNNIYDDGDPHWSSDGDRVIFSSSRDGNAEIYVMDADGSNQTRLTNTPENEWAGTWSPVAEWVLFERSEGGDTDVYMLNAADGEEVNLTEGSAYNDFAADWSPDGSSIAFVSNRDGNYEIYTMKIDGTEVRRITDSPATDSHPAWSPDGRYIVFQSNRLNPVSGETGYSLYIAGSDGLGVKLLSSTEGGRAILPDWQPIPNTPPVLATKTVSLLSGSSVVVDVLSGATDEEPLSASNVSIISSPSHGSVIVESGRIKYVAANGYVGLDTLEYRVCDSFMLDQQCSAKTLPITVTPTISVNKVADTTVDGSAKVVSSTNRPTFSGTTTPLAQVKVEIHSDPVILTTQADSQGNWLITPTSPLPPGDHAVYISSTLNGQVTQLDSFVLGIQATIPNTGADYSLLRYRGLSLLGLGIVGIYAACRRKRFDTPESF